MPVVFKDKGFFFYSNEGDPLEPLHIHVRKGESVARFWVSPQISVAESDGINASELRKLVRVVSENRELIERCWNEYFDL